MPLLNMQVFDKYLQTSFVETVDQNIDLFNAASGGAIVLTSARNEGDFSHETFWKGKLQTRRRDAYGNASLNSIPLEQGDHVKVKIAGGTELMTWQPHQLQWVQKDPKEAAVAIGTELGQKMVQDKANAAISSLSAAIRANTNMTADLGTDKLTLRGMNTGARNFKDRLNAMKTWVMTSTAFYDVMDNALANTENLFEIGTVNIRQDQAGRRFVVTDCPGLIVSGTPDKYVTLGLQNGAATVEDNGDFHSLLQEKGGQENIRAEFQAQWSFNLGLKGYSWDTTSGGKSPNETATQTGANWPKIAASDKDTAGVAVVSE